MNTNIIKSFCRWAVMLAGVAACVVLALFAIRFLFKNQIMLGPPDSDASSAGADWFPDWKGGGSVSVDFNDPAIKGGYDFVLNNTSNFVAGAENYAVWRCPNFALGPAAGGARPIAFSFAYKLEDPVAARNNLRVQLCFWDSTGTNFLGERDIDVGAHTGDSAMTSYRTLTINGVMAPPKARTMYIAILANINPDLLWASGTGRLANFSVTTVPHSLLFNAGVVTAVLVAIPVLIMLLILFWRRSAVNKSVAAPVQKPDRFWRWFAVAVFAMIAIPFLISIVGLLAAIAIPNFLRARVQSQENARHAAQMLAAQNPSSGSVTNFYIGQAYFPQGDSIEITSVERNENQMIVKGHYNLVSADSAKLAFYITTQSPIAVPTDSKQEMQISKGRGDFELTDPNLVPGLPHVSMYANGKTFAALYFGTKAEALEEKAAGWITNSQSATADSSKDAALPAVQAWLALMDAGAFPQSWEAASDSFQKAVTKNDWVKLSGQVRQPLGPLNSRKEISAQSSLVAPGLPRGFYFIAQFETSFAGLTDAVETVVFVQESDARFRAVSYLIRPRTTEESAAVKAAQIWLAGIDAGNYAESWTDAADYFRGAITQDKWVSALESVRAPLGKMEIRTVDSAVTQTQLPGAPDGKYVVMQFNTAFANKNSATETVTFSLENDGQWRASGYYIK